MANVYIFEVSGLEPLKEVKIYANNEKHAIYKIETTRLNGQPLKSWKLLRVKELDDKVVE